MRNSLVLTLLVSLIAGSQAARILVSIFTPSYSHQVTFRPLWRELAKRGHDIVLLTTDPDKEVQGLPNLRQVDLSGSYDIMEKYGSSKILSGGRSSGKSVYRLVMDYWYALDQTADWQLGQPESKQIIRNRSESFDLVITEIMNPIHMGFAERFNVPFIGVASLDAPYRVHAAIGNYMHPIVYPDYFFPFNPPLSYIQRLLSCIFNWLHWYFQYYVQYPYQTEIARKHFGNNLRELADIEKDMSFLFINVNPLFHLIRPSGLNTIIIGGGLHIGDIKNKLSEDLQNYMDNANDGVIYFSLGTNIKSILINHQLMKIILETFAELPYRILWKFENNSIEGLPKNVKIVNWVPQKELLGHPNLKLFITQCGLQSIEEAIFNHVPMVGISFMGDQHSNAIRLQQKGLGLSFKQNEVTKISLRDAILEVVNNPRYKQNVIETSNLSKDVEKSGLEKAVWWTEYCIRTKGAKHLRSPAVDMPVYQFYMLDVLVSFILLLTTVISLLIIILKALLYLIRRICCSKKTKTD